MEGQALFPHCAKRVDADDRGPFPYHTWGTWGFVFLLQHWRQKARDSGFRAGADAMLRGLVRAALHDEDLCVRVTLGPVGKSEDVEVEVGSGMVWIKPLLACRDDAGALLRALDNASEHVSDGRIHMMALLDLKLDKACTWAHALALGCVSKVLEGRVDEIFGECNNILASGYTTRKRKRLDREICDAIAHGKVGPASSKLRVHPPLLARIWLGLRGTRGPENVEDATLLAYYCKSRRVLTHAHHMSIALDAGRIGLRDYMCGVLVCKGGGEKACPVVAAALPPQAPCPCVGTGDRLNCFFVL